MQLRGAQSCLAARSMDRVKPKFLWAYPPSLPHVPFCSSQTRPPHHSPSKLLLVHISDLLSKLLSLAGTASSIRPRSKSPRPSRSSSGGSFSVKSSPTNPQH